MTNVADTIWFPNYPKEGDYANGTAQDIVDPSGVSLVDPAAVQVVDSGITFTGISATTWTDSPGS